MPSGYDTVGAQSMVNVEVTINPAYAASAFREVIPPLHKGERIMVWVPANEGMPEPVVYEVELVDVVPKPAPSYSALH